MDDVVFDIEHHREWKSIQKHPLQREAESYARVIDANEPALAEPIVDGFDLCHKPERQMRSSTLSVVLDLCIDFTCSFFVDVEPTLHRP